MASPGAIAGEKRNLSARHGRAWPGHPGLM